MAQIVIETGDQSTTTYIANLVNAIAQIRRLNMRVMHEGDKVTIVGELQVVTFVKQYVFKNLLQLKEIQGKIESMLKSVEEAQITKE